MLAFRLLRKGLSQLPLLFLALLRPASREYSTSHFGSFLRPQTDSPSFPAFAPYWSSKTLYSYFHGTLFLLIRKRKKAEVSDALGFGAGLSRFPLLALTYYLRHRDLSCPFGCRNADNWLGFRLAPQEVLEFSQTIGLGTSAALLCLALIY